MLTWCVSTMLLVGVQGEAKLAPLPAAARGDAAAMLKERIAKVPTSGAYGFESTVESEGGGRGGGRGGGGGAPGGAGGGAGGAPGGGGFGGPRTETTSGTVDIGKTAEFRRKNQDGAETVAYKTGTKLVYKKGDAWEAYAPPDFSGGGGGPPGGGGAGGGRGGGGDMRERFALMGLANMVIPHELLAGFDTKLQDVKSSEADGATTFTGTLTEAAADELSGAKRMREQFERFAAGAGGGAPGGPGGPGGGAPATTASGTATITFDKAGNVTQVVIETKSTGQRGEMKRKQTVVFKDWGKAKVEVPAEAAAKLTG